MDQEQALKTYLLYGDSGVGKSSFIKSLGGKDITGELPLTGGAGEAMTTLPGKTYLIDDDVLGKIQLIDTRGTWDPSQPDNEQILKDLVKTLLDFSVDNMQNEVQAKQHLDGIIYVHKSLDYDRYHRNQRIAHLQTLLGNDLMASTVSLMTQYNYLNNLDSDAKDKFNTILQKYHYSSDTKKINHPYVLWDSSYPLPDQRQNLLRVLKEDLKPFDLNIVTSMNQKIIERALELQKNDIVLQKVKKERKVRKTLISNQEVEDEGTIEKSFTTNCPKGFLMSMITTLTNSAQGIYSPTIETEFIVQPHFPSIAKPPIKLMWCRVEHIEHQNTEIVGDDQIQFEDKGQTFVGRLRYRWKPTVDYVTYGKLTMTFKYKFKYRNINNIEYEENELYEEEELLPRYADERPYLQDAQKQLMEDIYRNMNSFVPQSQQIEDDMDNQMLISFHSNMNDIELD